MMLLAVHETFPLERLDRRHLLLVGGSTVAETRAHPLSPRPQLASARASLEYDSAVIAVYESSPIK